MFQECDIQGWNVPVQSHVSTLAENSKNVILQGWYKRGRHVHFPDDIRKILSSYLGMSDAAAQVLQIRRCEHV
jgi:hypothetical protein